MLSTHPCTLLPQEALSEKVNLLEEELTCKGRKLSQIEEERYLPSHRGCSGVSRPSSAGLGWKFKSLP